MESRGILIAALAALLCCLAVAETEVDSFTCEVMNGSYYYDLSALQDMTDSVYSDLGTRSEFYFAVCAASPPWHCPLPLLTRAQLQRHVLGPVRRKPCLRRRPALRRHSLGRVGEPFVVDRV